MLLWPFSCIILASLSCIPCLEGASNDTVLCRGVNFMSFGVGWGHSVAVEILVSEEMKLQSDVLRLCHVIIILNFVVCQCQFPF